MTDIPLPSLQDAVLDDATLDQLFFDLEASAELCAVLVKGAPSEHAEDAPLSLAGARETLRAGGRAVQIRYRYGGAEWWDTLVPTPGGTRLVRIEQRYR
jgi:hypothetical protein